MNPIILGDRSKTKLHSLDRLLNSSDWKDVIESEYCTVHLKSAVYDLASGKDTHDVIKAIGLLKVFLDTYRSNLEADIASGEIMKLEGEQYE